jgi:8-oxo-dGTP pyrophosphatase MutT (NUDIX family)
MAQLPTTWDGQPVSPEKPYGVTVVVYRRVVVYRWKPGRLEFLILHRSINGPDYEGDWAWTPPSGARHPGEDVDTSARRELFEETGLELTPILTDCGTEDWWVYMAKALLSNQIVLSVEHDRFEWVSPEMAVQKCSPEAVSQPLQRTATHLLQGGG